MLGNVPASIYFAGWRGIREIRWFSRRLITNGYDCAINAVARRDTLEILLLTCLQLQG